MATSETVAALLRTRSTMLADHDRTAAAANIERLLIRSNASGTMQLAELADGELKALTALPEPVGDAAYVPGARLAVIAADAGGDERDQLYVVDLEAAAADPITSFDQLTALTSNPAHGHFLAGITPDGQTVAYVSTKANGVDFDLWTCAIDGSDDHLVWASNGWTNPAGGISPDGRYIALERAGPRPLDGDLVIVDLDTGEAQIPLPHPNEGALLGRATWISPTSFYVASNIGSDFSAIVHHDLASGATTTLPATGEDADADYIVRGDDGTLILIENRDAATVMRRYDSATGLLGEPLPTREPGVCFNYRIPPPVCSPDGRYLYYTQSSPRLAAAVFRHDLKTDETTQLTDGQSELNWSQLAGAELTQISSFDGEPIQLFSYRPRSDERTPPVVVFVHGGPESQSYRMFHPVQQALAAAGYGVVVPNVRGSTGYGKRFAALDDTTKRLDSVADLAAIHAALPELGFDSNRAALWGQSYGGYMVLAGVAFQPELWAAGVDIVGIANFVTFLENTSAYRRAHRELEYGSLAHDREFLIRASPMTHVDAIKAPLFVIHGRNDPRVPVGEAEQVAANLQRREVECELVIYEDEGHGLFRLDNELDAYPRAIAFLDRALGLTH
jgi:dipeptidyl aminopeptidase/acylaminoacyl peptidase